MKKPNDQAEKAAALRLAAEARYTKDTPFWEPSLPLALPEIQRMFHELRVHQIELEMQNEELRQQQVELDVVLERYFDLYDLAPVGYLTISETGIITEANLMAATMLGLVRGSLIKQPLPRFFYPDDQDLFYHSRKYLLATGQPQAFELRVQKAEGEPWWGHFEMTLAKEAGGTLKMWVVVHNIQDRKKAEEEQERLQAKLNQAERMESIGRLAGGVAHDFNNLLMIMLAQADLLLNQLEPNQQHRTHVLGIQQAIKRAAALTQQLLAFASRQMITPKILDVNLRVEEILGLLKGLMGENIRMQWQPGEDLWPVKVDPSQIDQVVTNLCINARAAISDVGTIAIETSNHMLDKDDFPNEPDFVPGAYIRLNVSDTGCGMDEEAPRHIFEPFYTTKGVGEGRGLGLATVYGIVRQNQGYIAVRSQLGRGTTFSIYLPRLAGFSVQPNPTNEPEPPMVGNETVLVVEDHPDLLKLTGELLTELGYRILTAATPTQALELAAAHPTEINIILTDVVMPEMNGWELVNRLRSKNPGLKYLLMSGYSFDVVGLSSLLEEGFNFIQKPFSLQHLAAKVREVLDQPNPDDQ